MTAERWKAAGKMKTIKAPPTEPTTARAVFTFGNTLAMMTMVTIILQVVTFHSEIVGATSNAAPDNFREMEIIADLKGQIIRGKLKSKVRATPTTANIRGTLSVSSSAKFLRMFPST